MRRIFLGIVSFILLASCEKNKTSNYIDDYFQAVYLAEEAYYKKDYQAVVDQMSMAEKGCELLNQQGIYEMLKYAEASAHIGNTEKAIELIKKLFLKGEDIQQIRKNEAFQELVTSDKWPAIEKEYITLNKQYLKTVNLELRSQISEMTRVDQLYRGRGSYDKQKCDSIDAINQKALKQIIETYGYPNERIIGGYAIDNQRVDPGILLFHFDDYEYWTVKLKELIKKGEAPPRSLGTFVDSYRRRVPEEKKFIYGIYDNVGEERIVEFEKLDERRVAIGLPPMKLKRSIDSLKRIHFGF